MKTKNTILLIIAFAFICSAVKAGEYHDDDKTALRNFLIQNSAETGKANGQQLGWDIDDLVRLQSDNWQFYGDAWVGKVKGLTWNEENPKRVTKIVWVRQYIAGSLDLAGCARLDTLCCPFNKFTDLDVSKNLALIYLSCENNPLTSLDVSKNIALKELYCGETQLTSLDVMQNTVLKSLGCYNNPLTSLDVSKNIALKELYCGETQLTSLDVTQNAALEWLSCYSNQLTSLDVSKNTALKELYCHNNQLTNLDVSNNMVLTYLRCSGNQLTNLDVSIYAVIGKLYCYSNLLKFSTLPQSGYNDIYEYTPQDTIQGGTTAYSSGIDLSSEYEIAENITDFTWFDITNGTLTPITLAGNNGIFSLDASYSGKTLICKMTNARFPDFDNDPLIYKVTITDDVSIDENNENLFINLYPNPSDEILTISSIDNKIFKSISLFDMTGKLLAAYNDIDNSIYSVDISQYPVGTYMLNIDGKTVRFVKQ